MWPSMASWEGMPIPFCGPSSTRANDSLLYGIHGENRNGTDHGQMGRKSGQQNGYLRFKISNILLEMMASLSWSVSWISEPNYLFWMMTLDSDKDFLDNWHQIDRTLLFDSSWVMSSQWLQVTPRSPYSAWGYGDVSCKRYLINHQHTGNLIFP